MSGHFATLAAIGGAFLLMAASPGPNFLLVSQLALAGERRMGVRVALGVGVGSATWAVLAMAGVAALLAHFPNVQLGVRLVCGAYLGWLGCKLLAGAVRGGGEAKARAAPPSAGHAFRTGLVTNMTNPKSGAFWTGIFGAMFPADAPGWMYPATAAMIATLSIGWYAMVATLLASAPVRRRYLAAKRAIDGTCGVLLLALGVGMAAGR